MDSSFSGIGIQPLDFIQISTTFLLVMVVFFGVNGKKHFWLNRSLLLVFALQCILIGVFHDGLRVKLFAALMLISTLTVEGVVSRKRKLHAN